MTRGRVFVRLAPIAATAVFLAPSLVRAGNVYDEGMLVAYPDFILRGLLPGRDFDFHYAPGSLWTIAVAFRLLGRSIVTERIVGLVQRLAILVVVGVVVGRRGRTAALGATLAAALLLVPMGASAIAFLGALAWLGGSFAFAASSIDRSGRSAWTFAALSGACAGMAALFRLDAIAAALVPAWLVLRRDDRRPLRAFTASMLAASMPLVAPAVRIGAHDFVSSLIVEPRRAFAGRYLPLPPRDLETLVLFVLAVASVVGLMTAGVSRVRRDRSSSSARIDLALGLMSTILLPQVLQRADRVHIVCVEIFAFALFPSVVASPSPPARGARALLRYAPMMAAIAVGAITAAPALRDDLRVLFAGTGAPVVVERAARRYPLAEPAHAADVRAMLAAIDRFAKPGDKVFVGPVDLRFTNLDDTFLYFLLPDLRPASYFTAMVPGLDADRLAGEIAAADVLLLTTRYDAWTEPNASIVAGSTKPSDVVARSFCRVAAQGTYALYVRCASPP